MSLNKNKLKKAIREVTRKLAKLEDQGKAEDIFVDGLANAIEDYVKSGTVSVTVTGITTAGSPSAQTQVTPVPASGDPMGGTGGIT